MKNSRKNKGFTLIELIVVMAIILILSSFLVPKFNGYRKKAERLKAIDMGRQIYFATVESYSENNGEFNKNKIVENINSLLGVDDIEVLGVKGNKINISYKIDKKQYYIIFNDAENGFTIKEESQQIYPLSNSKEVSSNGDQGDGGSDDEGGENPKQGV